MKKARLGAEKKKGETWRDGKKERKKKTDKIRYFKFNFDGGVMEV